MINRSEIKTTHRCDGSFVHVTAKLELTAKRTALGNLSDHGINQFHDRVAETVWLAVYGDVIHDLERAMPLILHSMQATGSYANEWHVLENLLERLRFERRSTVDHGPQKSPATTAQISAEQKYWTKFQHQDELVRKLNQDGFVEFTEK